MKNFVKTIILITVGIFMIPALYALGITLVGTVFGFLANPKVGMVLLCIFAVISLPGAFIAWLVKR